ncbi:hypothetical protein [Bradyrhizobium sp. AZCC 2289]|uniref:hypothetical protein n=1 Tax=Bradyrhizobium sp. AZCC 2289 TaxID=3117026 RepID=UPI002FEF019B
MSEAKLRRVRGLYPRRQTLPETFKGRARAAKPALVDGALALAVIFGGQLRIVLRLTISGDRIAAVEAVADAAQIAEFDVEVLER